MSPCPKAPFTTPATTTIKSNLWVSGLVTFIVVIAGVLKGAFAKPIGRRDTTVWLENYCSACPAAAAWVHLPGLRVVCTISSMSSFQFACSITHMNISTSEQSRTGLCNNIHSVYRNDRAYRLSVTRPPIGRDFPRHSQPEATAATNVRCDSDCGRTQTLLVRTRRTAGCRLSVDRLPLDDELHAPVPSCTPPSTGP